MHIFVSGTSSELLVAETSFWIVKGVFGSWCWTCMMELSGTCTCLVVKSDIFVLVSFAWFCRVIVSLSTLWSVLVKECFSHCYHQKCPETVSLSVQFQLFVTKIFYEIGDFHFLAIWLLFSSVMSILYGGLLQKFSRCSLPHHWT